MRAALAVCAGLVCLGAPCMAAEVLQSAPQCQAPAGRAAEQITGRVSAGGRFSQTTPSGWQLRLEPAQFGWMLEVGAKLQGNDDYSRLTPPWHGVPNPRQIEGWHFRNADNTGPNDGSVNAPQKLREFIFSPLVGHGIDYAGSATSTEDVERVRAFGQGWLFIDKSTLSPVARGQQASFQSMEFTACLTWPAEAGPPWMDEGDQAIARVKSLDVKELDPKLGNSAFQYWFITAVAAPGALVSYGTDDCGEQTGGNDGDRDIPRCVTAQTTTRSGARALVSILVGSVRTGVLSGTPVVFQAVLIQGDRHQWVKSLGDLTRAMAASAAPAGQPPMPQERDILEAVLEQPLGATIDGQPVRFGDPLLDSAEVALRDHLPRPWTATRIHALYQAAYTRLVELRQQEANERAQDLYTDEWTALVDQLGTILAASRDPRAALAIGRLLESPEPHMITCSLARSFVDYFGSDASYQRPAIDASAFEVFNGCALWPDVAHKWWTLNQREVEQRAAAITSSLPPCPDCDQQAFAAIDQLRIRRHDSAPRLHLTIQGDGTPRDVRMDLNITPVSGNGGGSGMLANYDYASPDIRIRIPGRLLGRSDMRLAGIVMSTGYRSVRIELDRINDARVVPITLVPE